MKRLVLSLLIVLVTVGLSVPAVSAGVGNRLPNGPHYNLNIIGVTSDTKDVGDSMGHTLFVGIEGRTKIIMEQDPAGIFQVLDRDGVSDSEALFNIAPGTYNVFARALGKPGNNEGDVSVEITSWAEVEDELGIDYWLIDTIDLSRLKGKPQTVNINKLFYIDGEYSITDGITTNSYSVDNEWIFGIEDPTLNEYWWDYDNNNMKVLQVRFYPCDLEQDDPTAHDYCILD